MYSIGSLADLISGSNTPNKPKVEIKEFKNTQFETKKVPQSNLIQENFGKEEVNSSIKKRLKSPKEHKTPNKKQHKSPKPYPTEPELVQKDRKSLKRKAETEDRNDSKKAVEQDFVHKKTKDQKPISINKKNAVHRLINKDKEVNQDPEQDERTIFVGNVPLDTKKKEVIRLFSKHGKVQSVRFRGMARASLKLPKKASFITKQFHPKTSTLNCYVVFAEKDSTVKAMVENRAVFKEHHLRVDFITKNTDHNQKKAIFVGNLPFESKDEDLWNLFDCCGKIESVRIVKDPHTGIGKGYGYVNFETSDAVEMSLQMTDVKLKNREIRIKRSVPQENQNKKRDEQGEKIRKKPRKPKHQNRLKNENFKQSNKIIATENQDTVENKNEAFELNSQKKNIFKTKIEYQGVKGTDKKKKKKTNKNLLQKKKMIKLLTSKPKDAVV